MDSTFGEQKISRCGCPGKSPNCWLFEVRQTESRKTADTVLKTEEDKEGPGFPANAMIADYDASNKSDLRFLTQCDSFCPIQMQMQAPMTEMIKDVMLPVA